MKIFSQGILARRKIVFIFLLAILLPSLIIGYFSFSTFAQRRESVRRLLESNLWISGESALKSIEGALLEHEKKALNPENFTRLTGLKGTEQTLSDYSKLSKEMAGQLFLLNAEYQIIIPKTGKEDIWIFPGKKNEQNTEFAQALKQAESLEFSGKNYFRAAELYRKCTSLAPTNQHKALALEALGRCLLSSKKYSDAYKVYGELSAKYGQFLNKAGHPYGILTAFQQYEIEQRRKREENSLRILLSLYGKIRNGVWLINPATYDFFIVEIESILDDKFSGARFPEIQESYLALQKQQPSYLEVLLFSDFLKREVVPKIKEKLTISRIGGEEQPGRLLAARGEEFCLVSYCALPNFQSEKTFYGGFCWNLSSLKKAIFPKILENITKDTGLSLQVIDERGRNILTGKEELA